MFARLWGWVSRTVVSTLLVVVAMVVAMLLVFVGSLVLSGGRGDLATLVVAFITLGELGFVAAAGVWLLAADDRREYVRVALPDGRDWRYVVGGVLVAYAVAVTATLVVRASGGDAGQFSMGKVGSVGEVGSASEFESVVGFTAGSVEAALLALVVLSVLVIGPSEELLFRGVVQRYLSGAFSRAGAIGVASVLFTAIHAPTFVLASSGPTAIVATATIFGISVTLGYSYALTDNLLVPAVVHGVYDATLFGVAYVVLQMGLS